MDEDKIDDYLLGRLENGPLQEFLAQLEKDTSLAKEVAIRREVLQQIEDFGDQQVKARIKVIHQQQIKKGRQRQLLQRTLIGFLILLLLAALGWWFWERTPRNLQLYKEHHRVYALNFGSRDQTNNPDLLTAAAAYQQGDFTTALPLLQKTITATPNNTKVRLAIGLCQQELQQDEEALQNFSILIDNNDPLYGDQARWYAALSQLRLGNTAAATNLLQPLGDSPAADFHEEALQLLGQIK